MADKVTIYIDNKPVGLLSVDEYGTLSFQYMEEYISSGDLAISESLPLTTEQYYGKEAHAFFTGLLPEEDILKSISEAIGTSPTNTFRLLLELGKECLGAIQIGEPSFEITDSYNQLTQEGLNKIIANKNNLLSYLYSNEKVRLSIAGAQSKVGLLFKSSAYYLPLNGAPSNVIVKPSSQRFKDLVYNEYATMKIAESLGIKVPKVWIESSTDPPLYVINRYDRLLHRGKVDRVHQEDFCQALGVQTRIKYESDGGPGFVACIGLLRRAGTIPAIEINKFTSLFLFNLIIGNKDAHGKNYSLLRKKDGIQLAPAYDLVCTSFYEALNSSMAMSVNDKFDLDTVDKEDLLAMARASQISGALLLKEYNRLKENILPNAEDILRNKVFPETFSNDFANHLKRTIKALPF